MEVLVTGVTGFVGERLVPALRSAGHDVSALVRDREQYDPPEGVTVFEGDVLESDSLDGALADVDAAYYLIHAMGDGTGFEQRDRKGARNFARAADAAGIVYLSGLGVDESQRLSSANQKSEISGDVEGDDLSAHLRSRREVERVLADGDYELTVLRAAIVVGDGSAGFRIIRQLVG